MQKHLFVYLILMLLSLQFGWAQNQADPENPELKTTIIPYRPKIAEFKFNNLYEYHTTSSSESYGNASSEVERDTQMKIRLGIPIVMKESTLFGVQLKYDRHSFVMDFEDAISSYELYNYMETQVLTSLGGRFIYQKQFDSNKEITVIAGAELKSDEITWKKNASKYYMHLSYKVALNPRTKIGGGFSLSYTLATPQIYPLFSYEHKFNKKWTMDLYLPKSAAMRYKINDKFYITASAEVKGWRYAIHHTVLLPDESLTLRKSDIYWGLSFEHEIYDWLWAGLDTGITTNLRNYLAKPGDHRRDALIELKPDNSVYARFGLFIVPPRKFYK